MGACFAVAGCATSNATSVTPPTPSAQPETPAEAEAQHHRSRHGGGVVMLVAMSLKELDLSAEQQGVVEKIRADLRAKMEPPHAAGKELAGALADGVVANKFDRETIDPIIDKLVAAVETLQAASADAMNQLHATLTGPQRAQLVDKMQARAAKWHDAHGDDDHADQHGQSTGQLALLRGLNLTDDQKQAIRSNLGDTMKGAPAHDHKDMDEHMRAFADAFKGDTFDAKSLDASARRAATHMARWGATRLERFCEAAAPALTAAQRTKLADRLREGASGKES
jgi:Spy/CpxP family protein refolding chaperone